MARNKKPFPGMGAFVLLLNYNGTWIAHKGATTVIKLDDERRRLTQWPDDKVKIVPNVPEADSSC